MAQHYLETGDNYQCYFDDETHIVYIIHHGVVTPESTQATYRWGGALLEQLADETPIWGCVIDFRQVDDFEADNFSAARQESQKLRQTQPRSLEQVPTALLIATTFQELILDTSMKLAHHPQAAGLPRVKLVKTHEAALAHFAAYHAR